MKPFQAKSSPCSSPDPPVAAKSDLLALPCFDFLLIPSMLCFWLKDSKKHHLADGSKLSVIVTPSRAR